MWKCRLCARQNENDNEICKCGAPNPPVNVLWLCNECGAITNCKAPDGILLDTCAKCGALVMPPKHYVGLAEYASKNGLSISDVKTLIRSGQIKWWSSLRTFDWYVDSRGTRPWPKQFYMAIAVLVACLLGLVTPAILAGLLFAFGDLTSDAFKTGEMGERAPDGYVWKYPSGWTTFYRGGGFLAGIGNWLFAAFLFIIITAVLLGIGWISLRCMFPRVPTSESHPGMWANTASIVGNQVPLFRRVYVASFIAGTIALVLVWLWVM